VPWVCVYCSYVVCILVRAYFVTAIVIGLSIPVLSYKGLMF